MTKTAVCAECGTKNEYEMRKTVRRFEGEGYSFELEAEIPYCTKCNSPIWIDEIEDEITRRANQKIRECTGIVTHEEILNILEKYGASQKFMSRLLGWGEITLTRYISGGYTPSKSNSARIKELNNPYVFQKLLNTRLAETDGQLEKKSVLDKVQRKVNEQIEALEAKDKIYRVSNWFLAQATTDCPLTHLALQKLLFFAQGWSRALTGAWMFDDDCEAWVHGAVYRRVYAELRNFKYDPLPILNKEIYLREEEIMVLENVKWYYFDVYTAKALENICHREQPYIKARRGRKQTESSTDIISKSDMEAYYLHIRDQYSITKNDTAGIKRYLNAIL